MKASMHAPPPDETTRKPALTAGFTLIELSVVLVIIGLIVGGVLVGQDLIKAAALRAQITQIERFNTAANTFRVKYGYLPGDIKDPDASTFGFRGRGPYAGEGDGNGQIEGIGNPATANQNCGIYQAPGEPFMFWVDLNQAGLIEGSFTTAYATPFNFDPATVNLGLFLPTAKIGQGNYIYVWSGGYGLAPYNSNVCRLGGDHINYFGMQVMPPLNYMGGGVVSGQPGLTVLQAYNIDNKIDDGLPQSGNVLALYTYAYTVLWATGGGAAYASGAAGAGNGPTTAATSGSATTCYDNGSGSGPQQYSMGQNGGTGMNCALSFKFQ